MTHSHKDSISNTLVTDALFHTRQLVDVMQTENDLLTTHTRGEAFEEIIKQKRALSAKVEKLLSDMKKRKAEIKETLASNPQMQELEVVINDYQTTARKNVILLQAAHQTTTDVLNIFRRAVESVKPKAETYDKQGKLSSGASTGTLITKSV